MLKNVGSNLERPYLDRSRSPFSCVTVFFPFVRENEGTAVAFSIEIGFWEKKKGRAEPETVSDAGRKIEQMVQELPRVRVKSDPMLHEDRKQERGTYIVDACWLAGSIFLCPIRQYKATFWALLAAERGKGVGEEREGLLITLVL